MKKITIFIAILIASLNSLSAEETNSIITEETREARALVSATEKVSISSELSARVEKINYLLGDAFKKGDVLISFDCELYKAQKQVI
ncbi:MAG: biotin/lipoyl-binding protein, partial [Alphaproteobacteria bacterium]